MSTNRKVRGGLIDRLTFVGFSFEGQGYEDPSHGLLEAIFCSFLLELQVFVATTVAALILGGRCRRLVETRGRT